MGKFHNSKLPGENDSYRKARDELLEKEIDLRRQMEEVAQLRRALPFGGRIEEDYVFEESTSDLTDLETIKQTRMSELFAHHKDSLIIYSFMYPVDGTPCPMCTSVLDGLNGTAPHLRETVNLSILAKAPIQKIRCWASDRVCSPLCS